MFADIDYFFVYRRVVFWLKIRLAALKSIQEPEVDEIFCSQSSFDRVHVLNTRQICNSIINLHIVY